MYRSGVVARWFNDELVDSMQFNDMLRFNDSL